MHFQPLPKMRASVQTVAAEVLFIHSSHIIGLEKIPNFHSHEYLA
jgi:hypothetical protein